MGRTYVDYFGGKEKFSRKKKIKSAKKSLEMFDIIGILEDINEFEGKLSKELSVDVKIPQKNESPSKHEKIKISKNKNIMSKIKKICKEDIEVYKYAREMIGKWFNDLEK